MYGVWVPNPRDYRGGHQPLTQEQKILLTLATTVAMPAVWWLRGPAAAGRAWKAWKLSQVTLVAGLLADEYDSTGGGGPSESLTSTDIPLSLEQAGLAHQDPSAAGSKQSFVLSKPRKRCPTGFRWNGRRCVKR